jgi:single stranded DNA-binding protein
VSINRVEISGRLPRDPDLKILDTGTAICKFSLAVREAHWTAALGEHVLTHWISVVAWGEIGEVVADRYRKGDELLVVGQLVQEDVPVSKEKTDKKTRVRALTVAGVRKGRPADPPDTGGSPPPPF